MGSWHILPGTQSLQMDAPAVKASGGPDSWAAGQMALRDEWQSRVSAPCPAETAHLVALAPVVKRTVETLRGLGVAGLPERKAEPDFQRRPEPPRPRIDTSQHYKTVRGVGPDEPGRHGAPDSPPLFSPGIGR